MIEKAAPVITCPPDVTLACGDSSHPDHTGWATATNDNGGTIDISYADTNLLPTPNTKVVEWNFPNNPDVEHTYQMPGTYSACLYIQGADSCTSLKCETVSIGDTLSGCQAYFAYSIDTLGGSNLVHFQGDFFSTKKFDFRHQ